MVARFYHIFPTTSTPSAASTGDCPSSISPLHHKDLRAIRKWKFLCYQEMRCRCVVRHTPMLVCVIHACDNRPCTEAIVASLRMTTIQQCRAPPGTAWRVDDVPPSCRTGDDRAEPSHAPVDRRAELALQRSKGKRVVVSGVRRGLLSVDASGMGFRRGGGGTRNVATR